MDEHKICNSCKKNLPITSYNKNSKSKIQSRCIKCSERRLVKDKKICEKEGCNTRATFNFKGQTKRFCNKHKEIGMINVVTKKCENTDCDRIAIYNFINEPIRKYCSIHREIGMVNIKHKKCKFNKCTKIPNFNFNGEKNGLYCNTHKLDNMVDVINKKCEFKGCLIQPHFNFAGEKKGLFCNKHKKENMIDVINKKCKVEGCLHEASFNLENTKERLYCEKHKDNLMINLSTKKCEHLNCTIKPVFNFIGEKTAIFCSKHKKPNMINVRAKLCNNDECYKVACFNIATEKTGMYCNEHKEINMVNVTNNKCSYEGCTTRPSYGIPGNNPTRCVKHKLENQIKFPKRKCEIDGCKELAIYGIDKHVHCETHKEENEINFIERHCISCNFLYILNSDNKCNICSEFKTVNNRSYLQKQKRILALVEPLYKIAYYDKVIDPTCNMKRPDIVIDCKTHFLVIEVDENQHTGYKKECEEPRMNMITQSLGIPTFWIRYNPDDYKDQSNKKSKITRGQREELLLKWIEKCSMTLPENEKEFVRVCFLFYNGFDRNTKFGYEVVSGLI
jgi:hypothetical protein